MFLGWGKPDRDLAIWQHVRAKDICPSCGTRAEEWDEAAGGDRDAYHAEERRCRGCELIESRRESIRKRAKELGRGIYVTLVRRRR